MRLKISKLSYTKNINVDVMDCFVDADWVCNKNDRKSTTGCGILIYGNII